MQLPDVPYRFAAEILRENAKPLAIALDLDWIPAVEWGRFQHMRDSGAEHAQRPDHPHIWAVWDDAAGRPYVSHLEVNFGPVGTSRHVIPLQYFKDSVACAVSALVEGGQVNNGEEYRWRICAYPVTNDNCAAPEDDYFVIEESQDPESIPLATSLDAILARSRYCGPPGEQPDVPVLLSPQVMRETAEIATAAGTLEAGGILLGRFVRDAASGELALDVTAQIAAREAIASDASLRFTPETWQAVDAAIRLRGGGDRILGWWHSHPQAIWPCRDCPPERRPTCPSNRAFFSAMDVGVHRTAFQAAHNIALLLSFHADPAPRFDLFGWRQGIVSERGFHITDAENEPHR